MRPAELHSPSAEENCLTENVASLRSVKVATPPCAAKAAIPCGLAVRKQHKMLFAASKFEKLNTEKLTVDWSHYATQAPYFAVKVRPVISGTIGGFVVTPDFQVLDNALKPIQGLWAAGELANRAFYNRVYEPGTSLLIAYASGRAAGTSAAKAALSK